MSSLFGSKSIDRLNIFKVQNQQKKECKWSEDNPLSCCPSIERIISALDYYSALDIFKNAENLDIFASFINDIYSTQFLDDFGHLLSEHDKHLQSINEALKECTLKTCSLSHRHNEESNKNKDLADINLAFWSDTLDAAHFHIYHLFECGLRSKMENEQKNRDAEDGDSQYFDANFARKLKRNEKRKSLSFARFKESTNKFSLSTNHDKDDKNNQTFCDELLKYLVLKGVQTNYLQSLIKEEEFESDIYSEN